MGLKVQLGLTPTRLGLSAAEALACAVADLLEGDGQM